MDKFEQPWLIQRWKVKEKWKNSLKVSEYLKQDYMGSAEFEFGAVPRFLRSFHERLPRLVYTSFKVNRHQLHILTVPEFLTQYHEFLEAMAKDRYAVRLQERIGLQGILSNDRSGYEEDDFWTDLVNNVAIALEKEPLMNFKKAIVNSVRFMDEQKKLA